MAPHTMVGFVILLGEQADGAEAVQLIISHTMVIYIFILMIKHMVRKVQMRISLPNFMVRKATMI